MNAARANTHTNGRIPALLLTLLVAFAALGAIAVVGVTGLGLLACDARSEPPASPPVRSRGVVETDHAGLLERQIEQRVETTVTELRKKPKLVVATQKLDVTITRKQTDRIFEEVSWLPTISRGTSTVSLRLRDNRVQHCIDPDRLDFDVTVTDDEMTVVIHAPAPRLDDEIVEVQTDPDKLEVHKDMGWSHLESGRGEEMLNAIRREARDEVLLSGHGAYARQEARNEGKHSLRELFEPALEKLDPDIEVIVRYEDE